jgi:hypothetical protein
VYGTPSRSTSCVVRVHRSCQFRSLFRPVFARLADIAARSYSVHTRHGRSPTKSVVEVVSYILSESRILVRSVRYPLSRRVSSDTRCWRWQMRVTRVSNDKSHYFTTYSPVQRNRRHIYAVKSILHTHTRSYRAPGSNSAYTTSTTPRVRAYDSSDTTHPITLARRVERRGNGKHAASAGATASLPLSRERRSPVDTLGPGSRVTGLPHLYRPVAVPSPSALPPLCHACSVLRGCCGERATRVGRASVGPRRTHAPRQRPGHIIPHPAPTSGGVAGV